MMPPICATCSVDMRCLKTGDVAQETDGIGQPYKVWSCDRFGCPVCGTEVLVNFGKGPLAEHYQPTYAAVAERATVSFGARR